MTAEKGEKIVRSSDEAGWRNMFHVFRSVFHASFFRLAAESVFPKGDKPGIRLFLGQLIAAARGVL